MAKEKNKYFTSTKTEIMRSQIAPAPYNPRRISKEQRDTIKRGIKKFGIVGGLVWNKTTGYLVGGHQRLSVLDELNKYDGTPETDYLIPIDQIEVDEKTEKELNILLNNPNAQGEWDMDSLRELIPEIDYRDAGLLPEDLNLIGVDYTIQTEAERDTASAFEEVMQPVNSLKAVEKASKEDAKAQIKAEKQRILEAAEDKAKDLKSYVVLSFDSYAAKSAFMIRFGYEPMDEFLKGEVFSEQVERIE